MSDGGVARMHQEGYTESADAETVANVAVDLLTTLHVAGTLLDFPAEPPLARG
jgi:hypothetical protein